MVLGLVFAGGFLVIMAGCAIWHIWKDEIKE
jgi:hypothetical protein